MEDPNQTRRWLINVSGAALISNVLPVAPALAQGAAGGKPSAAAKDEEGPVKEEPPSPVTVTLAEYISGALDKETPPPVIKMVLPVSFIKPPCSVVFLSVLHRLSISQESCRQTSVVHSPTLPSSLRPAAHPSARQAAHPRTGRCLRQSRPQASRGL